MLTRLVATITIKQPIGYYGGPVHGGQRRIHGILGRPWKRLHVYLPWHPADQRAQHRHHPTRGLNYYSAVLPADLSDIQQLCGEPLLIRVRAVLSWAVPPSTTDPDAMPY